MSFVGQISKEVRKLVASYVPEIRGGVLLPCGGNFSIGAVLRSAGYMGRISACDITPYSSALGLFLAGKDPGFRESETCPEHLRGLYDGSSPLMAAASISLMLDLGGCWKMKNAWHERTMRQYREAWPVLMEKTVAKLKTFSEVLNRGDGFDYDACDMMEWIERYGNDNFITLYPPTYGTKGYLRMNECIEAALDWASPSFTELNFDTSCIYEAIERFDQVMIGTEHRLPVAEAIYGEPRGVFTIFEGNANYIYAKGFRSQTLKRYSFKTEMVGPFYPPDKRFTGKETPGLAKISPDQSNHLNELFMSHRVGWKRNTDGIHYALCLDRQIIGKVDFALPRSPINLGYATKAEVPKKAQKTKTAFLKSLGLKDVPEGMEIDWIVPFFEGGKDEVANMQLLPAEERRRKLQAENMRKEKMESEAGYQIFQLCDLCVPSAEPRLSKLVLMLIMSKEVQQVVGKVLHDNFSHAVTAVFSNGPVSMKYRGLYTLYERKKGEHGGYKLTYYANMGQWTMQEAYDLWLRKYRK